MAKKKYYAVRVGKQCGIYESWDQAKEQISGFSGAEYKGFTTLEEAKAYMGGETLSVKEGRPAAGELYAYVDGSFDASTGRYAYGIVLLTDTEEKLVNGVGDNEDAAKMRNVAGELSGAMYAMKYAANHGFQRLVIFHDYEGIAKWAEDEWKTNLDCTQKYKLFCIGMRNRLDIRFQKVAAHTGNYYNEKADELAKDALGIKK